ncbi:MAG: hypothetical protein IKZ59_06655 [Clostridia bacterium]|nr:hypothetical protein [Clostridia bacterium]
MKKIIALLLLVCLLAVCCGCDLFGGDTSDNTSSKKTSSTESGDNSSGDDVSDNIDSSDDEVTNPSSGTVRGTVDLSGDYSKSYIVSDDEDYYADTEQVVEFGTSAPTLETAWDKMTLPHLKTSTDDIANTMRNSVINSPNSDYKANGYTGTTYYISAKGDDSNDGKSKEKPLKTTTALLYLSLKKGDAVLFERGGVWHLTRAILAEEGVYYGAYGVGEKPAIYGSPDNYAKEGYWKPSNLKNVWKLSIKDTSIGLVVINDGEIVGKSKPSGILSLEQNGDFYFNRSMGLLYLYCDGGNPSKVYKDIEVCLNKAAFDVNRVAGVTIDNFKIKYFGRLGIDLAAADNSVVRNCEVGFIGGASQNSTTRLGNAIQMWQGCDGHLVENCWTYQIYDTGLTPQGDSLTPKQRAKFGTHEEDYKNITYRNNIIEYCALSIEMWHGNHNDDKGGKWSYTDGVFENIHIENNLSRLAGYGWSSMPGQRPDPHGEHLIFYAHAYPYANGVYIENNIFDLCDTWICRWEFNLNYSEDKNDATRKKINGVIQPIVNKNGIWIIRNNTYYHGKNRTGGINWYGSQKTGSGQTSLENIIKQFDTSPTKIVWVS